MSRVWGNRRPLRLRRPHTLRLVACLAAVVPLLTACPDGDDGSDIPMADEGCTATYPDRLVLSTDVPEEVEYLDQVTACASSALSETYIHNQSDVVFTIGATVDGTDVRFESETLRSSSFREIATEVYPSAILTPESEVIVEAGPVDVTWTLHPGLSAMWLAHDTLATEVAAFGEAQLINMLSRNSVRRGALIQCSVAAYNAAGETGQLLDSSEPGEQLLAGLGIFSGVTTCARSWRAADLDALGQYGRTATWNDDIVRLGDDVDFLLRANSRLTRLRDLGRLLVTLAP